MIEVPWYVSDEVFVKHIKKHTSNVEILDCSNAKSITQEAFLQLSREKIVFNELKILVLPKSSLFPNLVLECLSLMTPVLEEIRNLCQNVNNTCDPLKCLSYFKTCYIKIIHDNPMSSYGRISKHSTDTNDKAKRQKWEQDLAKLAINCRCLEEYHCFNGFGYMNDKGLERLSILIPGLQFLELQNCSLSDEGFKKFFLYNKLGRIRHLIIENPGNHVTDKTLKLISEHCPMLETLKIQQCDRVSKFGIEFIIYVCNNLKKLALDIGGIKSKEDKTQYSIEETLLSEIGLKCPLINTLEIYNSPLLNITQIFTITNHFENLEKLYFYECPKLNFSLVDFLIMLPKLTDLSIVNCQGMNPEIVVNLIIKLHNLQNLILFCNTKSFYSDVAPLAKEAYMILTAESGTFKLNKLKTLSVSGVSGSFIRLLTVICSQIVTLNFSTSISIDCENLTEALTTCERLRSLEISCDTLQITDNFIKTLASNLINLQHFSINSSLKLISEDAFVSFLQKSMCLESLILNIADAFFSSNYIPIIDLIKKLRGNECYHSHQLTANGNCVHKILKLHFNTLCQESNKCDIWK